MRHLLNPIECPDIVQGVDRRRETAMEAEDLVVNKCGEGKVIEEVGKRFPYIRVAVLA